MKQTAYLIFIFLMLLQFSCSEVKPFPYPESPKLYYESNDTVLSADSHEFTISMTDTIQPKDWSIYRVTVWTGEDISDPDSDELMYTQSFDPVDYFRDGNTFGIDWISFEKIPTSTSPKLKISVKKNEDNVLRGIWIRYEDDSDHWGVIQIFQKPMPNHEPFTMKVRYKGTIYTTEARLNMNDEIEYSDSDFSRIMAEIDALDDVEAMVLEDEIVDYFDMSDHKASKAIHKLREKIDSSARCDIRELIPSTRAMDPYRFQTTDAIGYFAMFDDSGFKDTKVCANLKNLYDVNDCEYMHDIGLNDKVSSVAVAYVGTNSEICSVLTVWEDSFYNNGDNDRTKHRISFVATKQNPNVSFSDLKKIKCINSSNSWNDRISSYSFAFGNYDNYLKDY